MRRILYLWLPHWPIDRRRRAASFRQPRKGIAAPAEEPAFAIIQMAAGRQLVAAINPAAAAAGLTPGMPLADAFSYLPGLTTAAAEPAEDDAALKRLAEWCGRYSPWTAADGSDGVRIEITGCAHLWNDEAGLATDLLARLARQRIAARIAVADTLGAAFALARFAPAGNGPAILPPNALREGLAPLPVEALRLAPAIAAGLSRLGLKRISDLYAMPRAALADRFGATVGERLDQALGLLPEPLSPQGEAPSRRLRLSFAEPIGDPADLARAARRLVQDLAPRLAREAAGVRRLALAFHRVDGRVERILLGTARPTRDPSHLARLFSERLETIDPGPGIEDAILSVLAVEPLPAEAVAFPGMAGVLHDRGDRPIPPAWARAAPLLDRLANRLGPAALHRIEMRPSHIPERASARAPVASRHAALPADTPAKPPRPIRLFDPPQPIEAFWLLPDEPPFRFTWRRRRHRVLRAAGPERIAAEWWRREPDGEDDAVRDYYRVEDEEGRRFWLFRRGLPGSGREPRWFLHGVFA